MMTVSLLLFFFCLPLVCANTKTDLDLFFTSNAGREPFTISIGNANGTFYQYQHGSSEDPPYYFCQAYLIMSASKFITASAIGHAIETSSSTLTWNTYAYEILEWWTANPQDPRSKIQLKHFLSQSAGIDVTRHAGKAMTACGE
eukprot:gene802-472_t